MNDQDGTVFLIDDDPGVRDALTLLLSLKGMSTQPRDGGLLHRGVPT